jgi:hypothetical protein
LVFVANGAELVAAFDPLVRGSPAVAVPTKNDSFETAEV